MSDRPAPWLPGEAAASAGDRRHAPAAQRNREAIAAVLADHLPDHGLVLEIASGSGEHALHFAARFPSLDWQPSDPDPAALRSIAAWSAEAALPNLRPPLRIDARSDDWPIERADAILCINMVHISPWSATLGLMRGAARLLPAGGLLYLYGPYLRAGIETAPSNLAFDQSLRSRDPDWGLRDVADIEATARDAGLCLTHIVPMPANNLSLLVRRDPPRG